MITTAQKLSEFYTFDSEFTFSQEEKANFDKIKNKKSPPEGLSGDGPKEVAKWLSQTYPSFKKARAALDFFYNRAGGFDKKSKLSGEQKLDYPIIVKALKKTFKVK